MAKKPRKDEDDREDAEESFENEPSSLDEMTHMELRLMHQEASAAILFCKDIQWRSVGSSLVVFAAVIAIAVFTPASRSFANLLTWVTILLTCGVIMVLVMYQFWQFNKISRVRQIEKHFSSLYINIRDVKSPREGNIHRYTLLMFMITAVVLGSIVANVGIRLAL